MAKFKVGDRVIYNKSTVIPVFFEAAITEVDKTWYRVEYTDNNGNVQNEKCTEDMICLVATPKFPLMKAVTVIDNNSPYYGMTGTVKNFDRYQNVIYYDIILDYVYFENGCTLTRRQYFTDDQLKKWDIKDKDILTSKENKAVIPKFKVGDRVAILHEAYKGQEGIVSRVMTNDNRAYPNVSNDRYIVNIRSTDRVLMVVFDEEDIELSSNQDKSATEPKFKVGDLIRVVEHSRVFNDAVGKVYDGTVTIFGSDSRITYKIDFGNEELDQYDEIFSECDLQKLNAVPKFKPHDMVKFETQDGESECIGQVDKVICDVNDSGKEKFRYGVICRESKVGYFYKFESELYPCNYVDREFMAEQSKDFHLFVSQPMSGLTMDEIFKARESAIDTFMNLYEQSCNIDPDLKLVVIDNIQEEFTKQCEQEGRTPHSLEYLGNDIKMMKDADAIVFAKGWEKSKGCSVEFLVAKHNNNIPMYFE